MDLNFDKPMYRTIDQSYKMLKEMDEDTAISLWFVRKLSENPKITTVEAGNKVLIEFNSLLAYLKKGG